MSKNYTHKWTLANVLATTEEIKTKIDDENLQTNDQQDQFEGQYAQSLGTGEIVDKSIISVSVKADDSKRVAKQNIMPTWAATHSLMLSNTYASITRTNTEVIAPLFKTSPTDIITLYTVLIMTQGVPAVVIGPDRKQL